MKLDGVSAILFIAIVSFAVDRITRGVLFLLAFGPEWRRLVPDAAGLEGPAKADAERRTSLAYFAFASVLAVGVLAGYGHVRLLAAAGFEAPWWLDAGVTGLVLVSGADRLAALLKTGAGGSEGGVGGSGRPVEVTGRLVIEDPGSRLHPAGPPPT